MFDDEKGQKNSSQAQKVSANEIGGDESLIEDQHITTDQLEAQAAQLVQQANQVMQQTDSAPEANDNAAVQVQEKTETQSGEGA